MGEPDDSARSHPMVLAAQARLAHQGGWSRILAGEPLDGADALDAALLAAAGVLRQRDGRYEVAQPEFHVPDQDALAAGNIAVLKRALSYARSGELGWTGKDRDVVLAQGRSSAVAADMLAEQMAVMPAVRTAFESGEGRFLDVGVGVAAISIRLCELFPGARAVGIDVLADVLDVARKEVADRGCEGRIDLRLQDVATLTDTSAFDLAWVPQPFIPPTALRRGLRAVRRALRPDGWLVMPLNAPTAPDGFQQALAAHGAHLLGGGPLSREDAERLVVQAGFVDPGWHSYHGLCLLRARRP